jgi:hypothetical protein
MAQSGKKKVPENLAYARKDAIKQVLSTSWQWTEPGELGGRRKNADLMVVQSNGLERSLSKKNCRTGQRKPSLGRECTVRKNRMRRRNWGIGRRGNGKSRR